MPAQQNLRRQRQLKAAKDTTAITIDADVAKDGSCELADPTVNFVAIRQHNVLAPLRAGPRCAMCLPHGGS